LSSQFAIGTIKKGLFRATLGVLCIASMLTPFGESLDSTLTLHMVVQHFFYIAGGFLLASASDLIVLGASKFSRSLTRLYSRLMKVNASVNRRGLVTFLVAGLLTAYWHIPANFDAAVLNDNVHIMMHATFTIVGALMFIGAGLLTGRMRHILLLVPGKAMGVFGAFLMFTSLYVYPVYPAPEQTEAGLVMVVMMLLMDVVIVPYWLFKYFGNKPAHPSSTVRAGAFGAKA
jgi:cytochrome c oxidase assembly factor CtaG